MTHHDQPDRPDQSVRHDAAHVRHDADFGGLPLQIALIAHDHNKAELLDWAAAHRDALAQHELHATGTTGALVESRLGLPVVRHLSGPLGGDLQIGALIAEGGVDLLVFFWDPLEAQPHDPDVKALLRAAVLWNVPIANNVATADLILRSPLMTGGYRRAVPDHSGYATRSLPT
jgi:methylglyoxal synthase